ncbi:hypothetical protein MMC30_005698 [Trapelia coarctata]|nr:hypothetical protein [Trapelia coarctata]
MNAPDNPRWKRALSILLPRSVSNPDVPTKAKIKACFCKDPSYNPGAHIFIHPPPSPPASTTSAAMEFAQSRFQGYSFLIDTVVLGWDPAWKLDSPKAGRVFWQRASAAWAEEASGRVYVILPRESGDGWKEKGSWWRKARRGGGWRWWKREKRRDEWSEELEILLKNGNVREIVRVDLENPGKGWRWLNEDDGKLRWRKDPCEGC